MPSLVLELKQGELMVLNGAPIRFRSKATIELLGHARFLFGKQLMSANEADTPARRIYFTLQVFHLSNDGERDTVLPQFRNAVAMFREATTSAAARLILDMMEKAVLAGDCYAALKLARRIIRHEDAVFSG